LFAYHHKILYNIPDYIVGGIGMKISDAFRNAGRVYFGNFGATLKFLVVELCMTLAALSPLLFLAADGWLKWLALLIVPFWLLLMLWARVNAAGGMQDALNGGSLFSMRLADPTAYKEKVIYGLKRCGMLLLWAAPLIAGVVIARIYMGGKTDGLTVLRMIKKFGGNDLSTGMLYLGIILIATLLLFTFGCAFHSGDRHAFVRGNPKLLKGHRGGVLLSWLCSLVAILPMLVAVAVLVVLFMPVIQDPTGFVTGKVEKPPMSKIAIIAGVGAVLTLPFLPLRSLIVAAYVDGLKKE